MDAKITESILMQDEQHVSGVFQDLSAPGVRIAFDGLGSSFSPLNYVKVPPGHDLKIRVTTEEVENGRQVASLSAIRCTLTRGSRSSEPLTSEPAGAFVAANTL